VKYFLIISLLIGSHLTYGQKRIQLYFIDSTTNEFISDVSVFSNDSFIGYTNNYGYITIKIKKNIQLKFQHINYEESIKKIDINKLNQQILLNSKSFELSSYTLSKSKLKLNRVGSHEISMNYFKKIPFIMGELDVFKAVQTMPGVLSSYEANTGLYVRGGNIDQCAIYLDDAPIFNINHLYGFFSAFDGDAVKSFSIHTSNISSIYGGRGSSVLDVKLRDGNLTKLNHSVSIGFLTSKIKSEGPIIKNKLSYYGNIRYAYPGFLINRQSRSLLNDYFFDGNLKLKWNINPNKQVYFSTFKSFDYINLSNLNQYFTNDFKISKVYWGNQTYSLRYTSNTPKNNFISYTASHSRYKTNQTSLFDIYPNSNSLFTNTSIQIVKDLSNFISYGFFGNFHTIEQNVQYTNSNIKTNITDPEKSIDFGMLFKNKIKVFKNKYALFSNLRIGLYKNLIDLSNNFFFEPRFSFSREFKSTKLYVSYDKTNQFQHYIGNKRIFIPNDYWIMSNSTFKSQKVHSYSLGMNKTFKWMDFKIESYYKSFANALDLKDGSSTNNNINILNDILVVDARAYGAEFLLEKKFRKFNGHLSYTLSRSERKNNLINNNKWFPSNFDRTHVSNLVLNYTKSKKWSWGLNAIYQNGVPITIEYQNTKLYSLRNEYRLNDYFRIDISCNKNFKMGNLVGEWNISFFNILFIKNNSSQYNNFNPVNSLPILPSFSCKINF
jgi:hypothetical protein